jgi:hypothetical protein
MTRASIILHQTLAKEMDRRIKSGDDESRGDTVNNPPTRRERLSIQNHIADCAGFGDQPLSAAVASCPRETMGIVMRGPGKNRGGGTMGVLGLNC